ncbi:hypothetical protein L798_15515 [Zootermopsis nevadensis]|uniref:Uncharacterized protein n=1 Tax=Zootermopsis nevadensis TaxID=136037 RepID=A0A067QWJ1_ZOONE|nr:hypothetical protein L798_15515 [Zootermopsis nevadensis]
MNGVNWDEVSRRQLVMPHPLDFEGEEVSSIEEHFGLNKVSFLSQANVWQEE